MKKNMIIFILIISILIININISLAQSQIQIIANKNIIEKGEELKLKIEVNDAEIASFTLEIYLDKTKIEYKKGEENTHDAGDRIIYTWVSDTGENSNNIITDELVFQGGEAGSTNVVVIGEFYNSKGEKIDIKSSYLEIKIKETEDKNEKEKVIDNNVKLSVLRLNKEGISPEFNKDIKEYYFITNEYTNNLEVTAIPENNDATVIISGNDNLKMGLNTISIKVKSNNYEEEYKIYVTKTNDIKKANSNLENLAVEQAELIPEFDSNITEYTIELENEIEKVNILAVPQNSNAIVKIIDAENLVDGNNKIEINVLAEDKITNKKYNIMAYKKAKKEEIQEQENKIEQEKQNDENMTREQVNIIKKETQEIQEEKEQTRANNAGIIVIFGILIIGVCFIYVNFMKTKNTL